MIEQSLCKAYVILLRGGEGLRKIDILYIADALLGTIMKVRKTYLSNWYSLTFWA
jgi:hypothetical protein